MKRLFTMMLALVLAASVTACGSADVKESETKAETVSESEGSSGMNMGIANPWTDYDTLEEAEKAVGFNFSFRDVIGCGVYYAKEFRAMEGMLEITYYADDSTEPAESYVIRQAKKTTEDISGDYNTYSHDFTVDDCGIDNIRLRGTKDSLAVCSFDYEEYSYVIYPGSMDYAETFVIIGELTGIDSTEYSTAPDESETEAEEGAPVVEEDRRIDADAIDMLAIAGTYEGAKYKELSLSMYTSTDNNYVGNVEILNAKGKTAYACEIQEIATNYYGLAEDDVTFTVYTEDGTYGLDLYIGGEHVDYLTMTEHYES